MNLNSLSISLISEACLLNFKRYVCGLIYHVQFFSLHVSTILVRIFFTLRHFLFFFSFQGLSLAVIVYLQDTLEIVCMYRQVLRDWIAFLNSILVQHINDE